MALLQNGDESQIRACSNSALGSRLSNCVRNGRSVVHKNLEDNYGAVISANHEALAQILEQQVKIEPKIVSFYPTFLQLFYESARKFKRFNNVEIARKFIRLKKVNLARKFKLKNVKAALKFKPF